MAVRVTTKKTRAVNTYTYNQFSYVASYVHTVGIPVAVICKMSPDALKYYAWLLMLASKQRHHQNLVDTTKAANPEHNLSSRAVKAARKELKGLGVMRQVKRGVIELLNPETAESLPERKKASNELHTAPAYVVQKFYEYFLGPPVSARSNAIYFDCPWCGKKKGLYVRIAEGERGHSRWWCFRCGDAFNAAQGGMVDFFARYSKRPYWQATQMLNDLLAGREPWEPGIKEARALTPEESQRRAEIRAQVEKHMEELFGRFTTDDHSSAEPSENEITA